jgi:hypothetical protein
MTSEPHAGEPYYQTIQVAEAPTDAFQFIYAFQLTQYPTREIQAVRFNAPPCVTGSTSPPPVNTSTPKVLHRSTGPHPQSTQPTYESEYNNVQIGVNRNGEAITLFKSSDKIIGAPPVWLLARVLTRDDQLIPPTSEAPVPVASSVDPRAQPDVAMDASGNALAVWIEAGSLKWRYMRHRKNPGCPETWEWPSSEGKVQLATNVAAARVAATPSGYFGVVWRTRPQSGSSQVFASVYGPRASIPR